MGKTDDLAMVYDKILEENEISSYLAHHGIQGQKWGVRNGPPYPLSKGSSGGGKGGKSKRGTAGGQPSKMGALDDRKKRREERKKLKEIKKQRRKDAKNTSLMTDQELNAKIKRLKQENYLKKLTRENEGKREMKPGTPVRDVVRNEGIRMTLQMLVRNGPKKIAEFANFIKKKRTDMLLNNLYSGKKVGGLFKTKEEKRDRKIEKYIKSNPEFQNKLAEYTKVRQKWDEEYSKLIDKYEPRMRKMKEKNDSINGDPRDMAAQEAAWDMDDRKIDAKLYKIESDIEKVLPKNITISEIDSYARKQSRRT